MQIRRLLRIDRVTLLVKEYATFFKMNERSKTDKFMIIFKTMILIQDLTDLYSFLIQLKVIKKDHLLLTLHRRLANLNFL